MALRTKTTLIISSCFLALIGLLIATAVAMMLGRFRRLEEEEARRNLQRARDALNDQVANLQATTADWAHWDDAAAFVRGRMP
jgi:sensor domain CHASE-containing protein